MTNRELVKLLKSVSNDPRLGTPTKEETFAFQERLRERLGFGTETWYSKKSYAWTDYLQYYLSQTRGIVLRPLAVGFSMFAMVLGGWVTSVNASIDSVPGDLLYPVKITTERIQLSFADQQKQARLHLQFAGRRLDELSNIVNSNVEGKDARVRAVVDSFKSELVSAQSNLQSVQAEDSAAASELAKVLERKSDEFVTVIDAAGSTYSETTQPVVDEAKAVAETTNVEAVDVIVSANESSEPAININLEKNFQSDLTDIDSRTKTVLGRLIVVETVSYQNSLDVDGSIAAQVYSIRAETLAFQPEIADAMNIVAAGGYRHAFEMIQEIESKLAVAEQNIAVLEIDISTKLNEATNL